MGPGAGRQGRRRLDALLGTGSAAADGVPRGPGAAARGEEQVGAGAGAEVEDPRPTCALVPFNSTAFPVRPVVRPALPDRVAVRPLPVASAAVPPEASSKG
jgi:hypothetical protein